MAINRVKTLDIVAVLSGTPRNSSVWDLSCTYRGKGVSSIGSHYVILEDGDVVKARHHDEHGNVDPRYNKHSVFIELMGMDASVITPHQQTSLRGVISTLEGRYPDALSLELFH